MVLAVASLFVGVVDLSAGGLLTGSDDWWLLVASRLPRTLAILLAGVALPICGLLMQQLARNRFVEPSTAGTVDAATLGLLVVTLLAPGLPVLGKLGVASVFALAGTAVFLLLLRRIPLRSIVMVPLVGLMFGGVIAAGSGFLAYRFDLLQALNGWMIGDFSGMVAGRYELLWIAVALTAVAWLLADRFTVAGMGDAFTTNLGLNYRRILAVGLALVAVITAIVVVTVGSIPFLGLIVPNVVAAFVGDNVRRGVPWVATLGAGFLLACDLVGRLVRFPYEIPLGVVVGVIGSVLFVHLLLRRPGAPR